MLGFSVGILDNTSLSFEWAHDKGYRAGDGGSAETADTLTVQLALVF